jgi:hypothetical protein
MTTLTQEAQEKTRLFNSCPNVQAVNKNNEVFCTFHQEWRDPAKCLCPPSMKEKEATQEW